MEKNVNYTICAPTASVGGYAITGNAKDGVIKFIFPKKPNWFNRLFCRLLLGWVWIDEKKYRGENK